MPDASVSALHVLTYLIPTKKKKNTIKSMNNLPKITGVESGSAGTELCSLTPQLYT